MQKTIFNLAPPAPAKGRGVFLGVFAFYTKRILKFQVTVTKNELEFRTKVTVTFIQRGNFCRAFGISFCPKDRILLF